MPVNEIPKQLRQTSTGRIFTYTKALAARADMAPHPPVTTAGLVEPSKKKPVIVAIEYAGKTYNIAKESMQDFNDLAAQHQDVMIENAKLTAETLNQKRYFKENFDPVLDRQKELDEESAAEVDDSADEVVLTEEQRKSKLLASIDQLAGINDPASFTTNSGPKVQPLEALCGFEISSVDRDDAWAAYQEGSLD